MRAFATRSGKRFAVCCGLLLTFAVAPGYAATIQIKIANVAYEPAQVTAQVGDTIEWINADMFVHTATARNGAWDVTIAPNKKGSVVLKTKGSIDYYCKFHPNMVGHITVGD